ncbi:MAG: hypothetical protein SH848_01935, partial [Saprospiraceae bacterium]|nr:hypothetical protein [Saprospiraceae bacterium]
VVTRLTDNNIFRTFFTLYLMATSDSERQLLNDRFWQDAAILTEEEQTLLRAELTRCFLRLPAMAAQLVARASATSATY